MYKRNMGEYLKDAKSAVEDAVNTGDYRELSNRLGNLAGDAIHELNRATGSFCGHKDEFDKNVPPFGTENRDFYNQGMPGQDGFSGRMKDYARQQKQKYKEQYRQDRNNYRQQYTQDRNNYRQQYRQNRTYAKSNPVVYSNTRTMRVPKVKVKGRVSSVLYTAFGSLGLVGFGITALVMFCIWAGAGFTGGPLQILAIIFTGVTLGSIFMLKVGLKQGKFVNRFGIYQSLLSKNKVCEIKRMAEYVNKSESFVVKELQKMMAFNMFRDAHFDDKKTCFMLGDDIYEQYQNAEKSLREREVEQKKQKEEQANKVVNEELEKAISEGRTYIQQLRKANDDIPGEEISRKLDRLETVISKIFVCVERHPEKLSEIRKFMQYYLPITIKLVNAYKEFDSQPIQGENIKNSKAEIENTLDTIDLAFEKLLDSLYEDEAMEVSSDISVLNALFAQEGLTKKDFDLKDKK